MPPHGWLRHWGGSKKVSKGMIFQKQPNWMWFVSHFFRNIWTKRATARRWASYVELCGAEKWRAFPLVFPIMEFLHKLLFLNNHFTTSLYGGTREGEIITCGQHELFACSIMIFLSHMCMHYQHFGESGLGFGGGGVKRAEPGSVYSMPLWEVASSTRRFSC